MELSIMQIRKFIIMIFLIFSFEVIGTEREKLKEGRSLQFSAKKGYQIIAVDSFDQFLKNFQNHKTGYTGVNRIYALPSIAPKYLKSETGVFTPQPYACQSCSEKIDKKFNFQERLFNSSAESTVSISQVEECQQETKLLPKKKFDLVLKNQYESSEQSESSEFFSRQKSKKFQLFF